MRIFKSKIDTWLLAILIISLAVPLILLMRASGASEDLSLGLALAIFAFVVALPVWLFTGTKYVVEGESLHIRSGPFKWTIPIKDITNVTETRNPISSPALSLDRLELKYGERKSILVSPRERSEFREAIGHPET